MIVYLASWISRKSIIKRNVMPSADKLYGGDDWIFQQDNNLMHTSTNQILVEKKQSWMILEWVAFSVTRFKFNWKSLVGFKKGNSRTEAIKHHWSRSFYTARMNKDSNWDVRSLSAFTKNVVTICKS